MLGGAIVIFSLGYGTLATYLELPPASQLIELQFDLIDEADLYYTLVTTWFVLLVPSVLLLLAIAVMTGGKTAAQREAAILRQTGRSGIDYYKARARALLRWFPGTKK